MKKCILAFILFLFAVPAFAIPQQIYFQGVLLDASNEAVSGSRDMTFSIYNLATGGTALWTEAHSGVSISRGLYTVKLGDTIALASSVFNGDDRWVGITVGTDAEMSPRVKILSTPFAYRAMTADSVSGEALAVYQTDTPTYNFRGIMIPSYYNSGDLILATGQNGGEEGAIIWFGNTIISLDNGGLSVSNTIEARSDIKIKSGEDIFTSPWADYSSAITGADITGWSSFTTKQIYLKKVGKIVFVAVDISGTSNDQRAYFNLPTGFGNSDTVDIRALGRGTNSDAVLTNPILIRLVKNSVVVEFYKDSGESPNSWTNSGVKTVQGQFWFEAN